MVSPDFNKSNRLRDVIHVMPEKKNPAARARGTGATAQQDVPQRGTSVGVRWRDPKEKPRRAGARRGLSFARKGLYSAAS